MKKYMLIVLSLFLINLVSATMTAPESVNKNENFELKINLPGFYALELNLPESFEIISDDSSGVRTDLYRTFTSGELILTLRPTNPGIYLITGQYSTGEGIKDLNSLSIQVQEKVVSRSCPVCPEDSNWSNCEGDKQIKIYYKCSFLTNYKCAQKIQTKSCEMIDVSTCDVGWTCKDENFLAYRSSDCSLSSIQNCETGCENNKCKILDILDDIVIQDLDINITDEPIIKQDPEITQSEEKRGFWDSIINFFKRIWDTIIFFD